MPPAVLFTATASKPAIAALAGLVPWAWSGISTVSALLARVAEVGGGDQQRRQLAVRPGGRLERNAGQAGDLGQHLLGVVEQFEHPLDAIRRADRGASPTTPAAPPIRSFRFGLYFIVHEPSG